MLRIKRLMTGPRLLISERGVNGTQVGRVRDLQIKAR